MSRLEKTIQKKSKQRKLRFISKVLFILFMSINLMICIFIVDKNAKMMSGEETYNIKSSIKDIQVFINEKTRHISEIANQILVKNNK